MPNVWFCIPSKKEASLCNEVLDLWRGMGYRIAVWRDTGDEPVNADLLLTGEYPGYARAVNALCREVLGRFPETEWIVTGGDDTHPDQDKRPEEIAAECTAHFSGTFGVMQPTGDRWGDDRGQGAYIDRVAGSPWMGAEFCRRMYGGEGPLYSEYEHMFEDEELQHVALELGVLWQRPDLVHYHDHWGRKRRREIPDYMQAANSPSHWAHFKAIFEGRKALGFPGHEPIPCRESSHA